MGSQHTAERRLRMSTIRGCLGKSASPVPAAGANWCTHTAGGQGSLQRDRNPVEDAVCSGRRPVFSGQAPASTAGVFHARGFQQLVSWFPVERTVSLLKILMGIRCNWELTESETKSIYGFLMLLHFVSCRSCLLGPWREP